MMNELAKSKGVEQNLMVRIDNTSPTITSGHHDKIIVIDNQVGFCGGWIYPAVNGIQVITTLIIP